MSTEEKTTNDDAVSSSTAAPAASEGNATIVTAAPSDDAVRNESKTDEVAIKTDDKDTAGEKQDATATATAAGDSAASSSAAVDPTKPKPEFDHTSRKVVINNVLKYMHKKDVEKVTSAWITSYNNNSATSPKLEITKFKKPPKDSWIKITLADESMVNPFIQYINSGGEDGAALVNGRGKPLFAKRADEMANNDTIRGNKRKERDGGGQRDDRDNGGKRFKQEVTILTNDEVRDKITPLWRVEYQEQLNTKAREMVNKCAKKIVKEIKGKFRILEREAKRGQRKTFPKVYEWVDQKRSIEMEQPVPSPQMYEYRNKCEYTVGYRLIADKKVDDVSEVAKEDDEKKGGNEKDVDMKGEDGENGIAEVAAVDGGDATKDETKEAKADETEAELDQVKAVEQTFQKVPAAGFLAQGWSHGVYPPHSLQNMPSWACGLADIFNDSFLPTSPIPPYDNKVHRGVWRTITLRCSLRTRECMVIVLHAPAAGGAGSLGDGADDYSDKFEEERARLVQLLTTNPIPVPKREFPEGHVEEKKVEGEESEGMKVTSIFFQEYDGLSQPSPDHPVQHAYGKKSLEEKLGNCTFQISPGAFFQTNTRGAEVLYNIAMDRIKEVTTEPKETLLLDVCCGTGTIGLTMLKEGVVGTLVGVDISKPAIDDARINAEKNGFTESATTKFIASAAEKVLPETMKDLPRDGTPIVAVVDPARDGLHGTVIKTLRANQKIQRLVYISCNPTGTLVRDAAMLCSPPTKKYPGRPFKPTKSQPVDMFPLTKHCEMVMTFDRMSKEEYAKYHGKE